MHVPTIQADLQATVPASVLGWWTFFSVGAWPFVTGITSIVVVVRYLIANELDGLSLLSQGLFFVPLLFAVQCLVSQKVAEIIAATFGLTILT